MRLLLYFDGAAKGNPGIAGAGAYITTEPANSKFEYKVKQYLGSKTNNQAEYQAIILGLKQVNEILTESPNKFSELIIKGDSDLIIKQLKSVKMIACCEYVFTYSGKPIKSIRTSFTTALIKSGVEKFRFHDLRHTFASRLVMNGVDLVTVQELMGHKSLSMTKRYSHPTPDHKKQAVESLNLQSMDTYMDTKPKSTNSESNVSTLNH